MSDRTRRVLVLNHFASPRGHAGGTRHVELFGRLQGWEHLILAGDKNYLSGEHVSSMPGFSAIPVTAYTSNGWRRVLNWVTYASRAFIVGLRQRRVDVVYASSPHLLAALAGWAIATVKRVPLVLEVRDLWPKVLLDMGQLTESSPVYRALSRLEGFLYRSAAVVVIMAEGSRTEVANRSGVTREIVYIPNGADPEDFVPSATRRDLRARYGFTRFTAIYAGAHGPANGLDQLLDAAKTLGSDCEIVLLGGGLDKERLVARASVEGLGNVRFMDPVPKAEMSDILAAADVGLHVLADVPLFQTAVSPNKVFDYMAAGLPILTNSPGIVGDLVTAAACGLVVKPAGLGDGLSEMLNKSNEISQLGISGRVWIGEHQSRAAMAKRLAEALGIAYDSRRVRAG